MNLSGPWSVTLWVLAVIAFLVVGEWIFRWAVTQCLRVTKPRDWRDRVGMRYQKQKFFWWMFAWFKLRIDPMFGELPEFLPEGAAIRSIYDVGCGIGVAGCALLEWLPEARLVGIDPAPGRIKMAAEAFGDRGRALVGAAPGVEVAGLPDRFDLLMILDVIHYLSDEDLATTLTRLRSKLDVGGKLIIRSITPPGTAGGSIFWRIGSTQRQLMGVRCWHRPVGRVGEIASACGFAIEQTRISGGNAEMVWIIAKAV